MLRIIDQKRYNTDTAEEIASYWNGLGVSDFHNCEETLYRTKKGNWFLYGEGGGLSRWRQQEGNGWCGGCDIEPLSPEGAYQWLEEHEFDNLIEEYFSETLQDA